MDFSTFVGLRWQDRGRGQPGYDCWGLLIAAFAAGTGIALPSHDGQYTTARAGTETAALYAIDVEDWAEIPLGTERPFDAAVMTVAGRFHVGLIVRRGSMLHMPMGRTSVIEPLPRLRLTGLYRHGAMC